MVRIVREYVIITRMRTSPEEDEPFIIDHKEIEKNKTYVPCNRVHSKYQKDICGKCMIFQHLCGMQYSYRTLFWPNDFRIYPSKFLLYNTH